MDLTSRFRRQTMAFPWCMALLALALSSVGLSCVLTGFCSSSSLLFGHWLSMISHAISHALRDVLLGLGHRFSSPVLIDMYLSCPIMELKQSDLHITHNLRFSSCALQCCGSEGLCKYLSVTCCMLPLGLEMAKLVGKLVGHPS